jgi:hypothetical protein
VQEEKALWVANGQSGYLFRYEKAGFFGGKRWKRCFCALNVNRHELFFYAGADANNQPAGRAVDRWAFTPGKVKVETSQSRDGKFCVNLSDPKGGKFVLGADDEASRQLWVSNIRQVSEGFKASEKAMQRVAEAKALVVSKAIHGGEEEFERDDFDEIDLFSFPLQAREVLNKIAVMLEAGLLGKEDTDALRQVVLAQVREMTAVRNEESYAALTAEMEKAQQAKKQKPSAAAAEAATAGEDASMIVCDVCSITNTHKGSNCKVCGSRLPRESQDLAVELMDGSGQNGFGPPNGKWLCQLPFRQGGTFKCFLMEAITVMDQKTCSYTPAFVLGCEFAQGLMKREQWQVRHGWRWFEKWHEKMTAGGSGRPFRLPEFPRVSSRDVSSVLPDTMANLMSKLQDYLGEVFGGIKTSEALAFLSDELVEKLVKIKENVKDELDMVQFTSAYQLVMASRIGEKQGKEPMNLDEMAAADEAATLMISFLRGDGRTVDMGDEKLQNLRTICVVSSMRLKASLDADNVRVIRELMFQAKDVLEHVEAALRVYVDTEVVLSA